MSKRAYAQSGGTRVALFIPLGELADDQIPLRYRPSAKSANLAKAISRKRFTRGGGGADNFCILCRNAAAVGVIRSGSCIYRARLR